MRYFSILLAFLCISHSAYCGETSGQIYYTHEYGEGSGWRYLLQWNLANCFWDFGVASKYGYASIVGSRDSGKKDLFSTYFDRVGIGEGKSLPDTDGDGVPDIIEVMLCFNPKDPDDNPHDYYKRCFEEYLRTGVDNCDWNGPDHPLRFVDSDGDGYSDHHEISFGSNPLNPYDHPGKQFGDPEGCFRTNLETGAMERCPPDLEPWFPYPEGGEPGPSPPSPNPPDGGDPGGGDPGGGDPGGGSPGGGDSGGGDSGGGSSGGGDSGGGDSGSGSTGDGGGSSPGGSGDKPGGEDAGGGGNGVDLSGIERRLDNILNTMRGGGGDGKAQVDLSGVEGQLGDIKGVLDAILDGLTGGGGGDDKDGDGKGGDGKGGDGKGGDGPGGGGMGSVTWEKPANPDDLKLELELDDFKDEVKSGIDGLGVGFSELKEYRPRQYAGSFKLPVGGLGTNVNMKSFDFSFTRFPDDISKPMDELRRFVKALLSAIMSLIFIMALWREIRR